jgi:hypothetical protein
MDELYIKTVINRKKQKRGREIDESEEPPSLKLSLHNSSI